MKEFSANPGMKCCIMVHSGGLEMTETIISLDDIGKDIAEKIPCLVALEDTSVSILNCSFKGDTRNEVITVGLLLVDPYQAIIKNCLICYHNGGGIMLEQESEKTKWEKC
jgi:hypothetical protein